MWEQRITAGAFAALILSAALAMPATATAGTGAVGPEKHRQVSPHRRHPSLNDASRPSGSVPIGDGVPAGTDGPDPPCCKK